jgi:GT2 family glycosyltransferase
MIPRRILEISGSFDPSFFLYFEETDLAHRVRKAGLILRMCLRPGHTSGRDQLQISFERHYILIMEK